MANETITSGAGLRDERIYLLDANGIPDGDQSGANGYSGIDVQGVQDITLNIPDVQPIQHIGDDYVFAQDYLPPNTVVTGSFNTGKTNQTLDVALVGTKIKTEGEWELDGQDTSKAGQEKDVLLMYHRQALVTDQADPDFGSRRWQNFFIYKTRVIPKGNTPGQGGADQNAYQIIPTGVIRTPWGDTFDETDFGYTRAVRGRLTSEYPLRAEWYDANGTATIYNLEWTPINVAKTRAYRVDTGANLTVSSVDTTAKTVTLNGSAPANIAILYETSDSI